MSVFPKLGALFWGAYTKDHSIFGSIYLWKQPCVFQGTDKAYFNEVPTPRSSIEFSRQSNESRENSRLKPWNRNVFDP